jgi:hypothetical protein
MESICLMRSGEAAIFHSSSITIYYFDGESVTFGSGFEARVMLADMRYSWVVCGIKYRTRHRVRRQGNAHYRRALRSAGGWRTQTTLRAIPEARQSGGYFQLWATKVEPEGGTCGRDTDESDYPNFTVKPF